MGTFGLIFIIIIFLFSVVIHEVSHGAVANHLGDPTAKMSGRLTLNPINHIDPLGSIILPGFLILMSLAGGNGIVFGWAKPVPINPYNLRDQKYGQAKVALAGPGSNLLIAAVFGIAMRFIPMDGSPMMQNLLVFFTYVVWVNLILFLFNLWPGAPFDGHHIFSTIFPGLEKVEFLKNSMFSLLGAIFFMMIIGFPIICPLLFKILTGSSLLTMLGG